MKIGVVTIYNSLNSGSYLQALSLCEFLKKEGYDSGLVRNRMYRKNRFGYRFLLFSKYVFLGRFKRASYIIRTYAGLVKSRSKYRYIDQRKADICVFGSDTIWNVAEEYFGKEWKHYFGAGYAGKKIAYAPSLGPTEANVIRMNEKLKKCIAEFDAIGVRDRHTYAAVSAILPDREVALVVDPTMLMDKSFFEQLAYPCTDEKFILFYSFGRIEPKMFSRIQSFAKEQGLKLICMGENVGSCDKYLPRTPLLMMGYFSKADYVITDTYHGSVFSIIFKKRFTCIDCGKSKVNDLLERFGLMNRIARTADDMDVIFRETIDFDSVDKILDRMRKTSKEFLLRALRKCEED